MKGPTRELDLSGEKGGVWVSVRQQRRPHPGARLVDALQGSDRLSPDCPVRVTVDGPRCDGRARGLAVEGGLHEGRVRLHAGLRGGHRAVGVNDPTPVHPCPKHGHKLLHGAHFLFLPLQDYGRVLASNSLIEA